MAALRRTLPVMPKSQWLDGAIRVPGESAGTNVAGAGAKVLHHSTEGASTAGAIGAYHSTRSWPTMTAEWTGARLRVSQHIPLNLAARALEHPAGTPETNRANVTQIEHVGFTDDAYRAKVGADPSLHVSRWPAARWAAIASLCREIEAVTGCPPTTGIGLNLWRNPHGWRQDAHSFVGYKGHTAHVFAPNNRHTDGTGFRIDLILERDDTAHRTLRLGDSGPDVEALQRAVRLRAARCGRTDHMTDPDGSYGPMTRRDAAFVAYILGVGENQTALADDGLSVYVQKLIRDPAGRNATQKRRAAVRRPKHCKGGGA
jgi:hypothetical protein